MSKDDRKNIPGVDNLLNDEQIRGLLKIYSRDFILFCIRNELSSIREGTISGNAIPPFEDIVNNTANRITKFMEPSIKRVINATGIVLHTNLGRAPLGADVLREIQSVMSGYSNLEFNTKTGKRGKRIDHIIELIKYVTMAEDAVVVNNNAAAVSLALRTFAEGKEVIISRGELIEIGGSFRLPEIMSASGSVTKEIGTTNRTRISDYEAALNDNTKVILKANKSNYSIEGFTEEAGIKELANLSKENNIIFLYDIGSGLLKNFDDMPDLDEPSVRDSIELGVDLVTFSCDKLLGGPQAGIIAGKKELVSVIAKSPLMRTYRVDKFTIAALSSVLKFYLQEHELSKKLPAYKYLVRSKKELCTLAETLKNNLSQIDINSEVEESNASCGGGTTPHLNLESYTVKITPSGTNKDFAKDLYHSMLSVETPIVGIVREGSYYLDVFTLEDEDITYIVKSMRDAL